MTTLTTMLDERSQRIESIRRTLDDNRFATEAIAMAMDAFDIWSTTPDTHGVRAEDTEPGSPLVVKSKGDCINKYHVTHREYFRSVVPDQYLRCRNVGLAIKVFDQLVDEHVAPLVFSIKRAFSLRQ